MDMLACNRIQYCVGIPEAQDVLSSSHHVRMLRYHVKASWSMECVLMYVRIHYVMYDAKHNPISMHHAIYTLTEFEF